MPSQIRRIVTAVDHNGTSVVHDREPVPALEIGLMPGAQFFQVWGTEGALSSPATTPKAQNATFFPGPRGTRFGLLTFPPEPPGDDLPPPVPDGEAHAQLVQQAEGSVPGLLGVFEPDAPGMHQTATVDYAIVVSGELYLELDDGVEVHLPTGSTVVQNGARHAWRNHSDAPATLAYVILAPE
jgi:quercetin dioxygenase-like cupin family protein